MQDVLSLHDSEHWLARFAAVGINANRVGVIEETLSDEMLKLNGMVVAPEDDDMGLPWVINHPVKIDQIKQVGPKRAPDIGEHSAQILESLGYDSAQIKVLRETGVI